MRRTELDYILGTMLDSHKDVSDLTSPSINRLQVETSGQLVPVTIEPKRRSSHPFPDGDDRVNLVGSNRRLTEDLLKTGSCDSSYSLQGKARFRSTFFRHAQIPSFSAN